MMYSIERPFLRIWLWLTIALSSIVHFEPAPSDLLIIGLLGVSVMLGLRFPRGLGVAALLIGVLLLNTFLASMLSPDPDLSMRPMQTRVYLAVTWTLLIAAIVYDAPEVSSKTIWSGYMTAAILAAILGVLAATGIIQDYDELMRWDRAKALFKDPNVYGPFLVPAIVMTLYRIETANGRTLLFYLAAIGILSAGLLVGFSRGSWLNGAVAVMAFLAIRLSLRESARQHRRVLFATAGMAVMACASMILALSVESIGNLASTRVAIVQDYDVSGEIGGAKSRFEAQAGTLKTAMKHPLGIGAGQSEAEYYLDYAPHNLYLHVLAEGGWLGGLAFYLLLALTFYRPLRFLRQRTPLQGYYQVAYASFCGLLVQSLFIDSTHWRHFYLMLGLLWGTSLVYQRAQSSVAQPAPAGHPSPG